MTNPEPGEDNTNEPIEDEAQAQQPEQPVIVPRTPPPPVFDPPPVRPGFRTLINRRNARRVIE